MQGIWAGDFVQELSFRHLCVGLFLAGGNKTAQILKVLLNTGEVLLGNCFASWSAAENQSITPSQKNPHRTETCTCQDAFWRLVPGTKRAKEAQGPWRPSASGE